MKDRKTYSSTWNWILFGSIILTFLGGFGVILHRYTPAKSELEVEIQIPKQDEWVDYGTIFEAGVMGEWDHILWGGFTGTVIKKDGTYYLYYQGSRDYRTEPDETVVWRSISVATSQDGINFTKYDGNPVITWFPSGYPNGNGEEGAKSGGVTLDTNGDIVLYYGANTAISQTGVNSDGRLAISGDGFNFTDLGIVLNHNDKNIWGSGDELSPIAVIYDEDQWIVYYLPNGRGIGRKLGVAWGNMRDDLDQSKIVQDGTSTISAWGMAGQAKVGPDTYAIFTNWVTDPRTEVRLMSPDAPNLLSDPVEVYRFEDVYQATIFLDEDSDTWFMYYRGEDYYGVKVAPARPVDSIISQVPLGTQKRGILSPVIQSIFPLSLPQGDTSAFIVRLFPLPVTDLISFSNTTI